MTRGPLTFKQRDVTRAIKAARAAGVTLTRIWIESDGKICLGIAHGMADQENEQESNGWDKALCHEDH